MKPRPCSLKRQTRFITFNQIHQEDKGEDPNKIRNERGEVTTNITEIQRITRKYYEQIGQSGKNG